MTSGKPGLPSKGEINRCGQYLVDATYGESHVADPDRARQAVRVLNQFRAAHARPLLKVRMGLVSFVRSVGVTGAVTQRLKREPRIVRKLHRMEGTLLARLEDVGGCRVVVTDGPELELLRAWMTKKWKAQIVRERDYIEFPKDLGYRAVHMVVERDDRRIEVQLRTRGQQQWADAIEAADSRLRLTLKDGSGPVEMEQYFSLTGEVIYSREYGLAIDPELLARFQAARDAVIAAGYYRR